RAAEGRGSGCTRRTRRETRSRGSRPTWARTETSPREAPRRAWPASARSGAGSENRPASLRLRVKTRRERREGGRRTLPPEIVDAPEQLDVGPQRREGPEEKRLLALARKRRGEPRGAGGVHAPLAPVVGNRLEVSEAREHRGRRLRAPSRQTGIAVRR